MQTFVIVLLICCCESKLSLVRALNSLCPRDSETRHNIDLVKVYDQAIKTVSKTTSVNGTSEEWIFEAKEDNSFLTVKFLAFDLAGPNCGADVPSSRYSTVNVGIQLGGVELPHYLFCKGRRAPVPVSSMGRLRVAYCHKYDAGRIEFVVSPESDARLLVEKERKSLSLPKNRKISWIYLNSLNGGIRVDFSNVSTKKTPTDACKKAFISVKSVDGQNVDQSLLPGGEAKACDVKDKDTLKTQFRVHTELQGVNITYKNAAFTITFWEFQAGKEKYQQNEASTDAGFTKETTDRSTTSSTDSQDDEPSGSMARIIALGCGGLFVLIVIIVTPICLKRRTKRTRSSSVKGRKSHRGTLTTGTREDGRISNAGSMDNAMYGQILCGDDTLECVPGVDRKERNQSKHKRLAELEEKYGPFPETSTPVVAPLIVEDTKPNSSFTEEKRRNEYSTRAKLTEVGNARLLRKGTRPLLPPPSGIVATRAIRQGKTGRETVPDNLYETIDHLHNPTTPQLKDSVRDSFLTVTSDEFSDDSAVPQSVSYDPVSRDSNYATILDGPVVSYDPVDEGEYPPVPSVEYADTPTGGSKCGQHVTDVKYHSNTACSSRDTPKIDIHPPAVMTSASHKSKSTPLLNDANCPMHKKRSDKSNGLLKPNILQAKSHDALNLENSRKGRRHYFAPRPSLPQITSDDGYLALSSDRSCSIASSLQEDAESYLRPRPSFPDAMIGCAYSSSEDLSEMRRRLLAASHPSLLEHPSSSENVDGAPPKSFYDSPRPSLADIRLAPPPTARYASPRRSKQA